MKKLFTLLAALACTVALNAATLNWTVPIFSDMANSTVLDGKTWEINDNISLSFSTNGASNSVKYGKTNALGTWINLYGGNVMTINLTDIEVTSITFQVMTEDPSGGGSSTPTTDWVLNVNGTTLQEGSDVWTGSAEDAITVTASKRTPITGMIIEYTANVDEGEDEGEYQPATLRFTADNTTDPTNVTVTDNDVTAAFTGTSSGAFRTSNVNYGTPDDYITIAGYYQPGGSSNNGTNSSTKGIFTFPCKGTLTIYAYYSGDGERTLQLSQNNETIFNQSFTSADFQSPEGKDTKIYPVYNVDVQKGTAYLLWPNNQVYLSGFDFAPSNDDNGDDNGGDEPDEPETPSAPDNTLDFQTAELFFSADQVGQGAIAQNVTLSDNGTSVDFTAASTSAQIDASNGYFGTAEDYITIPYRYRPGGKSTNGINSDNKGVFTFPCPGTLTIYAYNNQSDDRNLQLIQNDVTILDHVFKSTDAVNPPNSTRNVYPIVEVEVGEGTAYLLWPVNQVMLFGFKFEPVVTTITEGSIIVGGGTVLDQTSQSAVIEDGTLVISTEKETVWAYIQVPESATAVYYKLSDVKSNKNGRKVAPEGFQSAMPYEGYWVAPLMLNTNGTLEVQYEDEEGNLSPVSQFNYKVILETPTGIEDVIECLPAEDGIIYNIFGQKVDESYKGIVIKNGKKYIQK